MLINSSTSNLIVIFCHKNKVWAIFFSITSDNIAINKISTNGSMSTVSCTSIVGIFLNILKTIFLGIIISHAKVILFIMS